MRNATEAVLLTVQAAATVGALPEVTGGSEELHWIPADIAGRALVELPLLEGPDRQNPLVVHIWNPRAMRRNAQFLPWLRQHGLKFETLTQGEWSRKLESSD